MVSLWLGLLLPSPRAPAALALPRVAAAPRCAGAGEPSAVQPEPVGGPIGALVDAVAASRCGAINQRLVEASGRDAVLALTTESAKLMNAVNVATAMHRLATLEKKRRAERDVLLRDPRFEALLDSVVGRAAEFNARQTADVLWSCATLRHWPPLLLKPLLLRVVYHLERQTFEPHHLSVMSWAFATLECKPVRLLEDIDRQACAVSRELSPQNCANLLWGFAKLRQPSAELLPVVAARLESGLLDECKPVEVSDLAYAAAVMGTAGEGSCEPQQAKELLAALATRALPHTCLPRFSSRQLVTLVWAHARLGVQPPQETLDAWRQAMRAAVDQRPLQKADRQSLEASLGKLGETCRGAWIPDTSEPVESEADAVSAA